MDSTVYIIHSSVIVQNGLAEILRKNFKCTVRSFLSFHDFISTVNNNIDKSILFTEDTIANNETYLEFLNQDSTFKSYCIVNSFSPQNHSNQYSIHLSDSSDEIYTRVKEAFEQIVPSTNENEGLSNREIDVLKLVALGHSNKEIADKLFISTHTVISHRKNMTEKLGIKSISGLTVYAIINDYIDTTNIDINDLI